MHELSIAQKIIEIIQQNVPEDKLSLVKSVKIDVGAFSGVVAESLEFSFQALIQQTALSNAVLEVKKIPFVVHCKNCKKEFENDDGVIQCLECGSFDTTIISGKELQVKEIEISDSIEEKV